MKIAWRNLAQRVLQAICDYGIRRALWPMVIAGIGSLALMWFGVPFQIEWMIRIGTAIVWTVSIWGTASIWYLLIFGRWIE